MTLSLPLSQRPQQLARGGGNFVDSMIKSGMIRTRGDAIAADFAHKLQSSGVYLFVGWGTIGLAKLFDAAAH
jgi:hypothetical protein